MKKDYSRSEYHQRKFHKCPYCEKERKRIVQITGRNKGYQKTCGSRECLSASASRPEVIAKKAHRGPQHPLWISDRTKVKFRPRYEMTIWRKAVFERDDYTCRGCGMRGGRLQAHHILGYKQFPLLRFEVDNGLTLCELCHKKTDNYGSRGR